MYHRHEYMHLPCTCMTSRGIVVDLSQKLYLQVLAWNSDEDVVHAVVANCDAIVCCQRHLRAADVDVEDSCRFNVVVWY